MEELFSELIRVSIGTQSSLTRRPSASEWGELYAMAKKQSLVGICFIGIKKLGADADEGFARIGMSEMQYMIWMGITAKIQQKNEVVNRQCAEIQDSFYKDGLNTCILKGQGVAQLYTSQLRTFRQSGDIDLWVDASRSEIIDHVQRITPTSNVREHHLELKVFEETEVEVHYWPAVIRHFRKNNRLQRWFDSRRNEQFCHYTIMSGEKVCVPTADFHAIQQMAHMYHHLFDSGIGLRQVLDYYFVLETLSTSPTKDKTYNELSKAISHIGMGRFASAMMYVLQETMGLTREKMICEPNEEDGRFLLGEIMRGGNFGHYDDRKTRNTSNYFSSFYGSIFRNMRYLRFNPFDWFWSPLWRLYYFGWRKINGYH